jgi:hypothetical protein
MNVRQDLIIGRVDVWASHCGEESPNSNRDITRRWMCRLGALCFVCDVSLWQVVNLTNLPQKLTRFLAVKYSKRPLATILSTMLDCNASFEPR